MTQTLWFIYSDRFKLVFQSLGNSSDSSRTEFNSVLWDNSRKFSYFFHENVFLCVHLTYHCFIPLFYRRLKIQPYFISICFLTGGTMIYHQLLELSVSRTNFHGPKYVQVSEVLLYIL